MIHSIRFDSIQFILSMYMHNATASRDILLYRRSCFLPIDYYVLIYNISTDKKCSAVQCSHHQSEYSKHMARKYNMVHIDEPGLRECIAYSSSSSGCLPVQSGRNENDDDDENDSSRAEQSIAFLCRRCYLTLSVYLSI